MSDNVTQLWTQELLNDLRQHTILSKVRNESISDIPNHVSVIVVERVWSNGRRERREAKRVQIGATKSVAESMFGLDNKPSNTLGMPAFKMLWDSIKYKIISNFDDTLLNSFELSQKEIWRVNLDDSLYINLKAHLYVDYEPPSGSYRVNVDLLGWYLFPVEYGIDSYRSLTETGATLLAPEPPFA